MTTPISISGLNNISNNLNNTSITTGVLRTINSVISNGSIIATFDAHTIGNMFITGGNVGIGTTAPAFKLDINGNMDATGYSGGSISISGTSGCNIASATTYTGGVVRISGNSVNAGYFNVPTIGLLSTATINVTNNFNNASSVPFSSTYSLASHVHSYLGVGGGTLTGGLTVGSLRFGGSILRVSGVVCTGSIITDNSTTLNSEFGGISGITLSYGYLNSGGAIGTASGTNNYAIYSSQRIKATELNAISDTRIKKEIEDINDTSALETIRLIEPKKYEYKDYIMRGDTPVWGFIAQQVESVLPYAVKTIEDYIPNIYSLANVTQTTSGSILTLEFPKTNEIDMSHKISGEIVLVIIKDDNGKDKEDILVKEIIDDNKILIDKNIIQEKVFVIGQRVSDFKALNKDAIYTVAFAALQEVDRQLEIAKETIANQKILIQTYNTEIQENEDAIIEQQIKLNEIDTRLTQGGY